MPAAPPQTLAASDLAQALKEHNATMQQLINTLSASDRAKLTPPATPPSTATPSFMEVCQRIAKEEGVSVSEVAGRFNDPRLPPA